MRSRTRSRPLLLTILQIISASWLIGDDYLIGYRLTTSNSTLSSEKLTISKAMIPCNGNRSLPLTLEWTQKDTLPTLLQRHEEEFLEYAMRQPLHLSSNGSISPLHQNNHDTLTLPTQCYAVDFNEDFVTISLLK